jgi:hypothetical protein
MALFFLNDKMRLLMALSQSILFTGCGLSTLSRNQVATVISGNKNIQVITNYYYFLIFDS